MDTATWDGLTKPGFFGVAQTERRHRLADDAKNCAWSAVRSTLDVHPELVNTARSGIRAG